MKMALQFKSDIDDKQNAVMLRLELAIVDLKYI